MTFATRLTKVRYRSEHFDERTGMCYHQAPPSERVVVHVRDAEQAKRLCRKFSFEAICGMISLHD